MPRISAESVAEHVAAQRAAVLDAAIELFTTVGYHEVSLGDVAAKVGLARNSLYRYVPDKAHLLVEWFRRAVPQIVERWSEAVDGDGDPAERLSRWASDYLEWAGSPEHRLVAPLTEALDGLDADTRAEVGALHREMMAVVAGVVGQAGVPTDEVPGTVELLAGLVLGAARSEASGGPSPSTRRRLDAAIAALILPTARARGATA